SVLGWTSNRTANMSAPFTALTCCDAVNLDVEMSRPGGDIHKNAGGRILGKVAGIDRIDGGEFLNRRAIDMAFENLLQRRARRFQAKLHLLQHQFGLALY